MVYDFKEEVYPQFVKFLAFGLLGLVEYYLATFVVTSALSLTGLSVTGNVIALSATLLVVGSMLGGGMSNDN